MDIRENSFWYKLRKKLVPILGVIVVAVLIWFAFGNKIPGLIPLLKEGDSQKIADYLAQETGIRGVIAVILLQAIQVASIVMPGMAIQVAAAILGLCFLISAFFCLPGEWEATGSRMSQ